MVQNSLVKYIQEQIRAGYSSGEIRNYLDRYGYSKSLVNGAFQYAYPPTEVKHVLHVSKRLIAVVIAIVCSLVLVVSGIYMLSMPSRPPTLLDVQTDLISTSIDVGDSLRFTAGIFNLGKASRYDVSLRYEVYDVKDNLITFKEETIAIETRVSSSVSIKLDGAKPGNYYLRTTAFYGGKTAKATSAFRVVGAGGEVIPSVPVSQTDTSSGIGSSIGSGIPSNPEGDDKRCPSNCDDKNKCTVDSCSESTGYECRYEKMSPCCGNGACESGEDFNNCISDCGAPPGEEADIFEGKPIWERLELIKSVAKTDKTRALGHCNNIEQTGYKYDCFIGVAAASGDESLCNNIEDSTYKDTCYKEVADEGKNSDVCALIEKDSKRDQCYMDFATSGDYSVCDKLINKYLKQSCDSLKSLSEMDMPS